MKISLIQKPGVSTKNQAVVLLVPDLDQAMDRAAEIISHEISSDFSLSLASIMERRGFNRGMGTAAHFTVSGDKGPATVVLAGLGDPAASNFLEAVRVAVGKSIRVCERHKIDMLRLYLPGVAPKLFPKALKAVAVAANLASYNFTKFKSDAKEIPHIDELEIVAEVDQVGSDKSALDWALKTGQIIGESANMARDWVDMPPSLLTPVQLADRAKAIASKHNFKIKVFGEAEIAGMGMGGLAAVSRGSEQDCKFVVMEYECGDTRAPTVAFVGKGITFDSGGLSLKPASAMETMKEDMAGASAVIATADAVGRLKPKVNCLFFVPLAENLPSGSPTKPGDVVKFYNGKTAEILNTDAEGRLILADALAYAVANFKPDLLIDIATLTGVCQYALGPIYSGLMTRKDQVAKELILAGEVSGDLLWRLPLSDSYKPAIKSEIADMSNCGSPKYRAGATTAALFLENFVGDTTWAHLDIAGTAFDVPDRSYFRRGATGVGVALFVEIIRRFEEGWRAGS